MKNFVPSKKRFGRLNTDKNVAPLDACATWNYGITVQCTQLKRSDIRDHSDNTPDIATLIRATGFNPRQLSGILRVVAENRDVILRAWHDHFGN